MFSSYSPRLLCKMCATTKISHCFLAIVFVFVVFNFVEMKSVKKSLPRFKRSLNEELESITDPHLLAKQYTLAHQYGGVDVFGDIRQYKGGKIDTRNFGQNIHFWYKDRIRPGEKTRAVEELTNNAIKSLWRLINQMM